MREFLAKKPDVLTRVLATAMSPLREVAAVNATRNALFVALWDTGLPMEAGTGGRTKWNRERLGIPKTHALDAVCIGEVDEVVGRQRPVLAIKAAGRGAYQRTRLNAGGGIRSYLTRQKQVRGFQTGDMVRASVLSGKKSGTYTGRVAVRTSGSFNIRTSHGVVQGVPHRYCRLMQRADGYGYSTKNVVVQGTTLLSSRD